MTLRMPRLRSRFILKLGFVIIVMFIVGPYIFHLKLSRNVADEAEDFRRWQLHRKAKNTVKEIPGERIEKEKIKHSLQKSDKHLQIPEDTRAKFKGGITGNFEPPKREIDSKPGEGGRRVHVTNKEKVLAQQTIREFGFNMVASDKMAMDRVIPDTRLSECQFWHYHEQQPSASVILVFHNEGFSTLVRTIHSVINTSPPQFLKEVVLVDDFSTKSHLKDDLEEYIQQFGSLVKLYRNKEREGLIRTRTRGAELATGDVIVFLDAHCECNRNWLVPLLDRIRQNRTTMAVPLVDGIDWNDMSYSSVYGSTPHRGIFEWGFFYKETEVPQRELSHHEHPSEPYRSPTHAGGLFAMDRKYFHELGGYDPGLMIWGGENYELSFKIWQCGGSIEWVPCSHVGHIYRNHMPYSLGKRTDPNMSPVNINYMRVVEVWMEDEFKEYFYTREPSLRGYPIGDISKQLTFKKEHKCKSFRWFMENVAYDVFEKFPKPPPNKAWGEIRQKDSDMCWDTAGQSVGGGPIKVSMCFGYGYSQEFRLNMKGQIGHGERCILAQSGDTLHVSYCDVEPSGPWEWDEGTGLIKNTDLNKCVAQGSDSLLHLQFCNSNDSAMKWTIKEVFPWKNR